jgi:predicted transcriptional regulator
MFDGTITELRTRKDIHNTLLTNVQEAKLMAKGRWKTKTIPLDLAKLKELLTADAKRNRETYDSYQLVMEKRNIPSQAWKYEELLSMEQNPIGFPA